MTPRDLVCTRCWQEFFNTEALERCCTADRTGYIHEGIRTVTSYGEISSTDCSWCAYIRHLNQNSWMPEDKITTHLSPTYISSCTPKGSNIFRLGIDCHSPAGTWRGGYGLFLHAFTAPDDVAAEHVTARRLRTDVNSEAAIIQLETWTEECKVHDRCNLLRQRSVLPTRVIEVNRPGGQNPRILEPKGDLHGRYATLSYCWGSKLFTTLTRSNYDSFKEELDPQILPPTFRDAVTVARNMSIPYLWIDALCITQDSEDDKSREISRMHEIYASSTLTIVAASAKNVFEGFLHDRMHSEQCHIVPVRIQSDVFGTMQVNELDAACYDERLEPIAKRAWAMQESILAQRTLTFTTNTMMWRCSAGVRNFADSLYFPHDLDAGYHDSAEKYSLNLHSLLPSHEQQATVSHKDEALSCWLRVVTAYSLRVASLEQDKLNAIAGIAAHPSFWQTIGPRYLAGLWEYNLARQLTWRTSNSHRTLSEDKTTVYRPNKYRAPSWSWASIEGGVVHFDFLFDDEDETPPEVVCEIVKCITTPNSGAQNLYGEVRAAQLEITAPVRKAWFDPKTSNVFLPSTFEELPSFVEASRFHVDSFMASYPDVDLEEDPEATHGTDYRNMCGSCDETAIYLDPAVVLCVAISRRSEKDDGV